MSTEIRDASNRLLETLRLGVVPSGGRAALYTVGREDAIRCVEADLERCAHGGGAARCWLGSYGAGKTHMLGIIRELAESQNFLTTSAVLDPNEKAPSHPRRIYRELASTLNYPGDPTSRGLMRLLEEATHSSKTHELFQVDSNPRGRFVADSGQHLYLSPAIRWMEAILKLPESSEARRDAESLLLQWLEGRPASNTTDINTTLAAMVGGRHGHLYSLKDYRPWARIYGYLLSGLATMARSVGYSGVTVLIDEAEFYSLLSPEDRDYAKTFFQALSFAAVGAESNIPFHPEEELSDGGAGVLKTLPGRFAEDCGLYVVFAMTPHTSGIKALEGALPGDTIRELSMLTISDYEELVLNVMKIFEQARPDSSLPEGLFRPLSAVIRGLLQTAVIENPRQGIKFLVEFLEIATERRAELGKVFENLRQQLALT